MREYAQIFLNAFRFTFPHYNLQSIVLKVWLFTLTKFSLKENEAVILKQQNLIFSVAALNIWFVSWFRLSKIPNCGQWEQKLRIMIYHYNLQKGQI